MSTTIQGVQARLERSAEDARKFQVTILLYSRKRPGLKASSVIDPGATTNPQQLLQLVGTAGAACAEYLGENYGDDMDPGACSRDAIKAFGEECRMMAALAKDVPAKLKRLEACAGRLSNQHQDQLHRLSYLVKKNLQLLPGEVVWLNQRIGELHGAQL